MKIDKDTGYLGASGGRCYWVYNRYLEFSDDTTPEEIQAFADVEKKNWCGQEFRALVKGQTLHIRKGIDSGD